jgi:hypothetical protein
MREIARSIKAATVAGLTVTSIEVDSASGKIVVNVGAGDGDPKLNSADAVLEKLKHGQSK